MSIKIKAVISCDGQYGYGCSSNSETECLIEPDKLLSGGIGASPPLGWELRSGWRLICPTCVESREARP